MTNYDVVIGIEIHLELKTKTKMFSSSSIAPFNSTPNIFVHENDLGLPGTLPTVNEKGVKLALQACKLLNFQVDPILRFDRKNYTYFDLPKGYQITQYFFPIGKNGKLTINLLNNKKVIELTRMHIEEDTAKQIHLNDKIYLDYNRSGVGLIEIVTEPVIYTADEAIAYVSKLQEIISFANISEAKMNEGSMRCDINISLKKPGSKILGNRVEIKNLNSLNNIKLAIEYEIIRQSKLLINKKVIDIETRRFDENTNTTISMRKKTSNIDYHFFPEPNILPIHLPDVFIEQAISELSIDLDTLKSNLKDKYNLMDNQIKLLIQNPNLLVFFQSIVKINNNYELIVNIFFTDVLAYLNKNNIKINSTKLNVNNFSELIDLIKNNKISYSQSKKVLCNLFENDISPKKIIKNQDIVQLSNEKEIEKILIEIINNNLDMLKQYDNRKERVLKFYMGQAMKQTKGKINPVKAQKILENLIIKQID